MISSPVRTSYGRWGRLARPSRYLRGTQAPSRRATRGQHPRRQSCVAAWRATTREGQTHVYEGRGPGSGEAVSRCR